MISLIRTSNVVEALLAKPFLDGLDAYYPDFSHWYINRVVAEIQDPSNFILIAKDGKDVVGVALGKRDKSETKLRCVRIHRDLKSTGLGVRLIDSMIDHLGVRHPHCTVSEELIHQYSRIFVNRYGFHLSSVDKGKYRKGKLEYCFN